MGQVLQLAVSLTSVDCGECGGTYAINERFRAQCQEKGTSWTCPYCKTGWGFSGNGENDRLKKELAAERERKTLALARENEQRERADAAEREKKRLQKRIKNGVCPHCPRTFLNLARHIKCKHPEALK